MSRDCIVLWSLLGTTACFTEPPSPGETGDATTSDDTSTSAAETAGSAETAGTGSDEGSTSGGPGSTGPSGSTTSEMTGSSGVGSSTGAVSEILFDFYDGACIGQWEVAEATEFVEGPCGLMPMDANEAGGAWRFPTLMTMMGEQESVLVLQPPPLDAAAVRGTFSAANVVPELGAALEFDYAFVSVVPGAGTVGTMTFHAYVERPDGITTDILLEEALGEGTMGNLSIPLDTVVLGDLDNIVLEVRSDMYAEGQAVALWSMRVIAET